MNNKILKEIISKEVQRIVSSINEEHLDESGYTRLVRSLAGMEPSIDTVGIITAENPMGQKFSSKENKLRNQDLAEELKILGYGFYQVQGKYGNLEKPFVIPNVSKDDIMRLGEAYKQDSVIFVQKTPEGSVAELIETHGDNISVLSKVVLPLAQNIDDFYTIFKGRKFVIPFFDDVFKDKALVSGRLVDIK